MASDEKQPTVIKKYANRRLYHTGTSTYVTLEDLGLMVRAGEDFVVTDAKTGEDITRSVLTQIIFEQENKEGAQNLLPVAFLRQLIRLYGDSMQAMVPTYLEFSMESFLREQAKLREQMTSAFGGKAFPSLEEQVRANMSLFSDAMRMFSPFPGVRADAMRRQAEARGEGGGAPASGGGEDPARELQDLKAQMADMQAKLSKIADKG
ncbi:polyhydroxyalkanoate synthesis repressor PhaR [Salinarimonas ramus]|uniref:Polyhydroxyalkanoate synthesis repressor PhaR n=1 Tax=Salinarimonas ramus TaxID=690164 RepID=A0A917V316_9HYPH|nr:polyhydroxyalkanoate synthesis repressor PhaR [Salinarimonas ramus]GGK26701.1 polyhydroxyalkanoate synthesis repressor PhaR [Salinarimonas ramus]